MDITTSSKRSFLEDAWDAVKAAQEPDLRAQLRTREATANTVLAGGSIASVSGNGRATVFAMPSQATYTHKQMAELWRELLDLYGQSRKALNFCARNGFDVSDFITGGADLVALDAPVDPAVIVDAQGYFEPLCDEFSLDVADIVGEAVSDSAIFLWMMGCLVPITEIRSDYSQMRASMGGVA